MKPVKVMLVCLITILGFSILAYAEVPKMINYQGKITTPQGALVSDTVSMTFCIYTDATGGSQLWCETQDSVKVEFGVFSILLGSVNPIPASVFNGNTRYLGLKVGNDFEMTPRKAIVSVGYAYHSGTADTAHFAMPDSDWTITGDTIYHLNGNVGIGTTSPTQRLDVSGKIHASAIGIGPNTPWATNGIYLDAGSQDTRISWDDRSDCDFYIYEDGAANTLYFKSSGGGSWEQWKWVSAGLGDLFTIGPNIIMNRNVGIGTTSPAYKLDVNGDIRATGTIYGNFAGTIDNADKVDGYHYSSTWPTTLPNIQSACSYDFHTIGGTDDDIPDNDAEVPDNISINNGSLYAPSGGGNVGIGTTSPGAKLDVVGNGRYSGSVGDQQAILNVLNSGEGRSIYASTNASMNRNAAIYGDALDDGGVGVYGHTSSPGVSSGSSVGVFGLADNSGGSVGGAAMGVFGRVYSYQNSPNSVPVGVFGEAMSGTGNCWGVAGETWSTSPGAAGVKGTLKASGAQGRAIWGEAPSTTTGYAGYFEGRVNVTGALTAASVICGGSKCAAVQTTQGITELYSQESPEVWFEDFGEADLVNGQTHIDLDPLFLETVTINQDHPLKVFVTLNDECNGAYVKRGETGFDVIELNNGKSNAHFTYRIVAKRKGFEDKRLEQFVQPLSSKQEASNNE